MLSVVSEIFMKCLQRIESRLKKAKRPRAFKDVDKANQLRGELFKLEGWAKLHRHWPNKKDRRIFESIRFAAKELEDALGQVDLAHELQKDPHEAQRRVKHVLNHDHWFVKDDGETRVEKMRRHLESVKWPRPEIQQDYVLRALVTELQITAQRYRDEWKPKLLRPAYDQKILENDLHKFRRQLRWISMYVMAADGLIALGPTSANLTVEKKRLVAAYSENEFTQIPKRRKAVAHIDAVAFYELTRLIEELGAAKDKLERHFFAGLLPNAPTEVPSETQKIMLEYERLKPLAYLAESLQ